MSFLYNWVHALCAAGGIISALYALFNGVSPPNKSKTNDKNEDDAVHFGLGRVIAIVLTAAFLVLFLVMFNYTPVPNLVNLSKQDAIKSLYAADLEVNFPEDTPEDAIVITQSIAKGKPVAKGSTITLKFKARPTESPETSEPETTAPTTEPTEGPGPTIIDVVPGDVLTIGTYAGKSLDWKVLDVSGTKAFLLSTKVVKDIKYHDQEGTVTWGECSLRKWLNGSFLTTAFSKDEQAAILTTTVDNGADQGKQDWSNTGSGETKDKIFLLSYVEFVHYVEGTDFSICEAAYSTKPGEDKRVELLDNGTEAAFWWLRSPGVNGKQAAFINFEGKCFSNYATNWYLSARPAMWVDLEKLENL